MKRLFQGPMMVVRVMCAAVCAAMCAASCVYTLEEGGRAPTPCIADDAPVTLTFGVPGAPATKAFGEKPAITSMHVFLFNKDGLLLIARKAVCGSVTDNGAENASFWSVELPMGTGERHLHFVANLGDSYEPPASGSESALMLSLTTTGGNDAYWQEVMLPNGIRGYTYDGSGQYKYVDPSTGSVVTRPVSEIDGYTGNGVSSSGVPYYEYTHVEDGISMTLQVSQGDYIDIDGHKVLTEGVYASEETSAAVSLVPMIRNFARIRVKSEWSSFTIDKAVLINTPIEGFVAPFDDRVGHNEFSSVYKNAGSTAITHDNVLASGYPATVPGSGVDTSQPDESSATSVAADGTVMLYMYERAIPTEQPTAVLVHGTLSGKGERWFKIDVTDTDGDYFPIYRDCTYHMDIRSINGTDGYATLQEAFNATSVGDISGSPDAANLTRIDDGKGLELWVEYIDYTSTSTATSTVTLLYKFTYNSTNLSSGVSLSVGSYQNTPRAVENADGTAVTSLTGTSYGGADTPDSGTGWYQVSIPLASLGTSMKRSYVHVEGTRNGKTLFRNVVFRVIPKQDFSLSMTSLGSDAAGRETILTITLPSNVLGYSSFPLTLKIEAKNNCLTPIDNLVVETGRTAESGSTKNTFYFLKTINYDEYQSTNVYQCRFKTTKTSGNAPTTIYVSDKSNLFNVGSVALTI